MIIISSSTFLSSWIFYVIINNYSSSNGAMSSQDIALYLYEVGSNERKLQYCRQILASNTNFTPEGVFSLNAVQPRTSISRSDFADLVKALGIACTQQEAELVFSYFQIDGKNYLTLEEFTSLIIPQADPSLKSVMGRRKGDVLVLDYALKYSLQKFFGQVVENQVRLELLCKFTFEKQKDQKKVKYKRATGEALKDFLAFHGKYPGEAEIALILKEVGLNKGDSKRNRLIAEFILAFNQKRRNNQQMPKVYKRELTALADFKTKYQSTIQNQENIANSRLQSALRPQFSQLFSKPPLQTSQQRDLQQFAARTTAKEFTSTISNVSQVEDRIKTLMGSINLPSRPTIPTAKKDDQQIDKKKPPALNFPQNDPIKTMKETIKDQIKREKESQKSAASKSISKRLDFNKDKESIIKEIYSNDNRSQRRDLTDRDRPKSNYDFQSYTDRNKGIHTRNKRITEDNFENESNASSQVQMGKREKGRGSEKGGKFGEGESKKRIEYLRSLIDSKNESL